MNSEPFVLFLSEPNRHTREVLEQELPIRILLAPTRDALVEAARDAVAILTKSSGLPLYFDADLLGRLPSIRVLAAPGSGADCFDAGDATALGLPIVHNPGVGARAVVEYTLAVMPLLAKNLWRHHEELRGGAPFLETSGRSQGIEVFGKTLGVIGLGAIGGEVARRAAAGFGVSVLGFDPGLDDETFRSCGWERAASLEALLRESDFVTLHLPASASTRHLIGRQELALMKASAFLINSARGPVVDQEALLDALDEGHLAGAALDVFDPEPPLANSRVLQHPLVFVTPHLAGITRENRRALGIAAGEAVLMALRGDRPPHLVNPEVWGSPQHRQRVAGEAAPVG